MRRMLQRWRPRAGPAGCRGDGGARASPPSAGLTSPREVMMWVWVAGALAAREPVGYHEALAARAAADVEALNAAGRYEEAVTLGQRWQRGVEASSAVSYEIGYANN